MKFDEAAIEAAVRALPMRADGLEPDVSEAVRMIGIAAWIGQANARPRARTATHKQTLAELKKLCDLCRDLYKHIETRMRSPALRLVEQTIRKGAEERATKSQRPIYHPLLLSEQLEATFLAARTAWVEVKGGAELPQPQARGTKPAARDVTGIVARVFESVTGTPAARAYDMAASKEGGPFVEFLGRVFDALGIKASPAGQAKLYLEKRASKTA